MFHVNPATGEPGKCVAQKQCRFGGPSDHYTSEEAARAAFEKAQSSSLAPTMKKASTPKSPPVPRNYKQFENAILAMVPTPEDSSVAKGPVWDDRNGKFGDRRYRGALFSREDAQGNYRYQGLSEAVSGVRKLIADAKRAGELPRWVDVSVSKGGTTWHPALNVKIGYKKEGSRSASHFPESWIATGFSRRASTEAGKRLEAYVEFLARQYEDSDSNIAIDENRTSNSARLSWFED